MQDIFSKVELDVIYVLLSLIYILNPTHFAIKCSKLELSNSTQNVCVVGVYSLLRCVFNQRLLLSWLRSPFICTSETQEDMSRSQSTNKNL